MLACFESQIAQVIVSSVVLGITWLFSPALQAVFARDFEWDERIIREGPNGNSPPLLSIIVPAYDEERRIENMLQDAHGFMESSTGRLVLERLQLCSKMIYPEHAEGVQWIVIDDGSKDDTNGVVKCFVERLQSKDRWSLVTLRTNSGKGAAVKTGMLKASGIFRLMVDADGATEFGPGLQQLVGQVEETLVKNSVTRGDMIAIFGSRAHLQNLKTNQRSFLRLILMHAFHFFVSLFVSSRIKDTQCGFKLFTKSSAVRLFKTLHLQRWAFDIEVRSGGVVFTCKFDYGMSPDSERLACFDLSYRRNKNL